MTEREMLELAALAAGIKIERFRLEDPACGDCLIENSPRNQGQYYGPWNPRDDDGDALRLAVKLGFQLDLRDPATRAYGSPSGAIDEHHRNDPYAATRRAIVRAAAEIGRQMKEQQP